jgi:RNA polymerase sigma-70 factor (ECF subfamily)
MPDFSENEQFRTLLRTFPTKAVAQLYNSFFPNLLSTSIRLTGDKKASEDIIHDAFLHLWENHITLSAHHETSLQFYILRVVKNRSINFFKRSQRIRAITLALEQLHDSSNALDTIIQAETVAMIREMIQSFPKRERQCLMMQLDQHMSYQQIADGLQISIKSVERSITQARKRLRLYAQNI